MTILDSILESINITLPTKVHLVKAMIFPVVIYGYESWTRKKAKHRIIDAFELWCWRRLLRVPWTARRSNLSIIKEISLEYPLEELMLKLNLQSLGNLLQRTDSFGKDPDAGKDWRWGEKWRRGWDGWMESPTQWTWVLVRSGSWWWTGWPGMLQSMGWQIVRHDWEAELNWTLLADSSCCKKIASSGWVTQQPCYLFTVLEAGTPISQGLPVWFLVCTSPWLVGGCPLTVRTWSLSMCVPGMRAGRAPGHAL